MRNSHYLLNEVKRRTSQFMHNMDYVFIKSQKKGYEEYGSLRARVNFEGKVYKMSLGLTIKEHEWQKYKTLKYVSAALMTSLGIRYGHISVQVQPRSCEQSIVLKRASFQNKLLLLYIVSYTQISTTYQLKLPSLVRAQIFYCVTIWPLI